jgi:hypothetical protein
MKGLWRWSLWLWCMLAHPKAHVFVPGENPPGTDTLCQRCGGRWPDVY